MLYTVNQFYGGAMVNIKNIDSKDFSNFIHMKLREYNDSNSPHHKAYRKEGEIKVLNFIAEDNGKCIGGIIAEAYWGWLNIEYLWVDENFRNNGIGNELLKKVENIAIQNGCRKSQLFTFEFQAKAFYQKYGYRIAGILEDYPPESSYYWMFKNLE